MTFTWKVYLLGGIERKVDAHRWEITPTGDLIFFAEKHDKYPFQAISAGNWYEVMCYA